MTNFYHSEILLFCCLLRCMLMNQFFSQVYTYHFRLNDFFSIHIIFNCFEHDLYYELDVLPSIKGDGSMSTTGFPYQVINWALIPKTEHAGERGRAFWQSLQLPGLRIRIVEYSAGYIADHWCKKGHIVHCLEGEFVSELQGGEKTIIKKGMTYVVSDDLSTHRSSTKTGVTLLIVDGDFLQLKAEQKLKS